MSSTNSNKTSEDNLVRILRWPEVATMTGISRSQAHALAAENRFPKPIKLGGPRASGWLLNEISDWIENQVTNSRQNSAS